MTIFNKELNLLNFQLFKSVHYPITSLLLAPCRQTPSADLGCHSIHKNVYKNRITNAHNTAICCLNCWKETASDRILPDVAVMLRMFIPELNQFRQHEHTRCHDEPLPSSLCPHQASAFRND